MGEEKRTFVDENLSGARFERCRMTDLVIRGSGVSGMEIDDPWLLEDGGSLLGTAWTWRHRRSTECSRFALSGS